MLTHHIMHAFAENASCNSMQFIILLVAAGEYKLLLLSLCGKEIIACDRKLTMKLSGMFSFPS